MPEELTTKTDLVLAMDREWEALKHTIDHADPSELTDKTDPAGWSSKDHLDHLASWANSVLVAVRDGRPRWEGLGIDRALFETEGYDEKNEVIRQLSLDLSLDEVVARLTSIYLEVRRIVDEMSDADLLKPFADYVDGGSGETLMRRIAGSFPRHFREHQEYIERILHS